MDKELNMNGAKMHILIAKH